MPKSAHLHEDLARHGEVGGSSDRAFGVVFAVVFAIIALFPLLGSGQLRLWAVAVAAAFVVVALVQPSLLAPLNRLWQKLGLLLHRIVSPVVLGLLFYGVVLPTGLLMRLFGKRSIPTTFERERETYWIPRDPPGPRPEGMKNQF